MKKGIVFIIFILLHICNPEPTVQTHQFTAEVSRLMDILINSLYTQKQVFLRELISNASDALDKIRFLAITDQKILGDKKEFEIRIQINQEERYITITDTGIGMTKAELIQNLGTIAKSGTTKFIEAIKGGSISLIGQFGVGFYSTFLAGHKVQVKSKSPYDDQYIWVSQAASSYKVYRDPEGDTLGRGTEVKIHLKEDALQFLKHKRIIKLVKKYSEFIDFPILILNKKEVEVDSVADTVVEDDVEVSEKQQTTTQKQKKTVYEWEQLNQNKAIWLRDKDQIYDEEYIDFFKILSGQSNPPLNWIHFKAEGEVEFSSILFLPNRVPHDFFSSYSVRKNQLKLYVRRVMITQNRNELLPKYLSFVTGVVDSNELPLNVNRETLTQSKAFKVINQKVTKRILDMITEISKWNEVDDEDDQEYEDSEEQVELTETEKQEKREKERQKQLQENKKKYTRFYSEFGKTLKLGVIEDSTNRQKLAALTRWHTTWNSEEFTSLDDYISRMKKTQDQIYFFSGQDKSVLEKSPLVKGLVRKGYEVLLCDDPIDEYVFNTLKEYDSKNIVNVGKGDFKLPEDDETERKKQKYLTEMYKPYIEYAKKILFEKVGNVILSNRLSTQPCVVVADSYGQSSFMQKIQKSQMLSAEGQNPTANIKKILEINPHHRVNQILLQKIKNAQTDETIEQLVQTLYETAALQSGFSLSDPNAYAKRFYQIYSQALGVLNLERNENIEINQDIALQDADYEGDNEQVYRMNPGQFGNINGDGEDELGDDIDE